MIKLLSIAASLLIAFTTMAEARVHAFSWDSSINASGQVAGWAEVP